MTGYPIFYGNEGKCENGFTSEAVINFLVKSCHWNQENKLNFKRGYIFGTALFSMLGLFSLIGFGSSAAFADDSSLSTCNPGSNPGSGPGSNTASAPAPEPGRGPGSLATVPSVDRGTYGASSLGICAIAMKTGSFWVGFVCAAAVIIGMRMAGIPANE